MAKKSKKNAQKAAAASQKEAEGAWIPMRMGLTIITVISIGMGILTAYSSIAVKGPVEGTLWGVAFGAGVWVVFMIALLFNRFVRGKR